MTELRIGILGAPEAGKSAFASQLAQTLSEKTTVVVVDEYVNDLTQETGYAYGIFASYPQNLQVQLVRWTAEQIVEHDGHDILITVGTIYESILYTAAKVNSDFLLKNEPVLQAQGRTTLETFGMLQSQTAVHDLLFFLPYTEEKIKEKGRCYDTMVNEKLPEIVAGYFRPLIALTGSNTKKVDDALSAIKSVEDWKAQDSSMDDGLPV
jgi:hypothetical protein